MFLNLMIVLAIVVVVFAFAHEKLASAIGRTGTDEEHKAMVEFSNYHFND